MEEENYNETGGLRLMTVFVVVLLLHVLVIGGISAYHYMNNGTDMVAELDGDATLPDNFEDDLAPDDAGTASEEARVIATPERNGRLSLSPMEQVMQVNNPPANNAPAAPAQDQNVANANNTRLVQPEATLRPNPHRGPATAQNGNQQVIDLDAPEAPANEAPATAQNDAAPASSNAAATYTVAKGDTLWRIARKHNMKVSALKSLNGMNNDVIQVGQQLKVSQQVASTSAPASTPATTTAAAATPAEPATTTAAATPVIDRSTYVYDESRPAATASNSAPASSAAAANNANTHVVAKGETLWRIAKQYKTTPTAIANANGITDPSKMKVGTTLKIPNSDARSAESATTVQQAEVVMNR